MATSMDMSFQSTENVLKQLEIQFLEMVPLRRIKWQDCSMEGIELNSEIQLRVLQATVNNPLTDRFPAALSYQKAFMKKFVHMLEESDVEICDEVYEVYADLLRQREEEEDTLCYKTYTLPCGARISLQESVNMVSYGTTGLSTWQAAQHLAEWAIENRHILENRNIVEIGSGLGLAGMVICKQCQVQSFTFTDCHHQVLYMLSRNIEQNLYQSVQHDSADTEETSKSDAKILRSIRKKLSVNMESSTDSFSSFSDICESPRSEGEGDLFEDEILSEFRLSSRYWEQMDACFGCLKRNKSVCLAKLDWEMCDTKLMEKLCYKTDIVLAADVVYDSTIIPALVSVLGKFLKAESNEIRQARPCAYIASTVRNEDTRDEFLVALTAEELVYKLIESPKEQLFHYDRSVPIEILKITAAENT